MIKPPIILDENGNILLFRSKRIAEDYIEPEDVMNNEYIIYDSEGRLLRLEVTINNMSIFLNILNIKRWRTRISTIEDTPGHSDELKKKIIKFLYRIKIEDNSIDRLSLKSILDIAIEKIGYT